MCFKAPAAQTASQRPQPMQRDGMWTGREVRARSQNRAKGSRGRSLRLRGVGMSVPEKVCSGGKSPARSLSSSPH